MPSRLDDTLRHPAFAILLWVGAVAVAALLSGRYWIPLDDGTLAQSAERVLHGQLPHRDFGDPYTGLNAFVGAAAFKIFGVALPSLRIPLVVGFGLWLPAVWWMSHRFLPAAPAAVAALLASTLSVLAYPAAMPTWFGLFAVTWGTWCLLRWMDGRGRRWLLAAGAAAGVTILFKVVGLYFLAAALFTVAFRRRDGSRVYTATVGGGSVVFLLLLGRLVLPGSGAAGIYHFFLPALSLTAALTLGRLPGDAAVTPDERGVGPLLRDASLLTAGAVLPIGLFLFPYAATGSLDSWVEGVFLLPGRRLQGASSPPGPAWTMAPAVVLFALAAAAARLSARAERGVGLAAAAFLAVALLMDDRLDGAVMTVLWYSLRGWIPVLTLAGAAWTARRGGEGSGATFALLAVAGLWALVQFPYAAPAYVFYAAPLGVLATAACIRAGLLRAGPVMALVAGIYLFLGSGYVAGVAATGTHRLDIPRGGLLVSASDAATYRRLVGLVDEHRGPGGIWAGPDAPEVYFLAAAPNPTPTLYEFLDRVPRTADDLATLFTEHDVRVVLVNTRPLFSAPLPEETLARIVGAFPQGESVGSYLVRWRTP